MPVNTIINQTTIELETTHLFQLPNHILEWIIQLIPAAELRLICLTSRTFHQLCVPTLWSKLSKSLIINPNFLSILKKYGKFIKVTPPNTISGFHQLPFDDFVRFCPNIEVFDIGSYDMRTVVVYDRIFSNWPNLKSITCLHDYEWHLVTYPNLTSLRYLETVKLVNFYGQSEFVKQLSDLNQVKELVYEFNNFSSHRFIQFQFDQFHQLQTLKLDLVFFPSLNNEIIDDIFTKIDEMSSLKNFFLYGRFRNSSQHEGFLSLKKLQYGLTRLSTAVLDLKGAPIQSMGLIEYYSAQYCSRVLDSDNFVSLIPSTCHHLTKFFTPYMDSLTLNLIIDHCPNLSELGIKAPLPLLSSSPSRIMIHLKKLSVPSFDISFFKFQHHLRSTFPNLTHLYLNESYDLNHHADHWQLIPQLFPKLKCIQFYENFFNPHYDTLLTQNPILLWEELILSDQSHPVQEDLERLLVHCPNIRTITLGSTTKPIPQFFQNVLPSLTMQYPLIKFYLGYGFNSFEFGLKERTLSN